MRASVFIGPVLFAIAATGCLVHSSGPRIPEEPAEHEVLRRAAGQGRKRETTFEVRSDGTRLRDGAEREFAADGTLLAERSFRAGQPCGLWRTWYADGTARSEIDLGDGRTPGRHRFWHPNGVLAAEGPAVGEVREGPWSFWDESGTLLRSGPFHAGLRHGRWTLWEGGRKVAEGDYDGGVRVGQWTLWDAEGVPHERGRSRD